jgi:Fe-S cluster assembly protein SufD
LSLARGLEPADLAELPSRRGEDWHWTDLRALVRQPLEVSREITEPIRAGGPFNALGLDEVVIANGRLNWWPDDDLSEGLRLFEHQSPDASRLADQLPMARLAASHAAGPAANILEFGGVGANAALVRFVSRAEGTAHHARLGVVVKPGVSATLIESYEGSGWDYLSNVLLEIFLEEGARLERIVLLDDVPNGVSVSTAEVFLTANAAFAQTVLTGGAKRQRIETRVSHPGAGASARLDGVYLLREQRHADITTVVTHAGMDGTTDQLTKGVVTDQARGVFQGRIVVRPGADKTDARMGHHALVLSDRAEVDAKPELEIFADDVACAHGNTVGALDEDALFYAEQRGIPEPEARAMLTEAFVGEVIDRIEHEAAREIARAWAAERLGSAA